MVESTLQAGDSHSTDRLAAHIRALPISDQLELLRKIAPEIIGNLEEGDRQALVADINVAIMERSRDLREP